MRKAFTALAAGIAALASPQLHSQAYPAKPVRMVLALGGGAEVAARAIGDGLQARMGQPFLVEAQPGAGGAVGAEMVAKAAPDGYTILLGTPNTHVYRPNLVKSLPYDPLASYTPIGKITDTYSCIVAGPGTTIDSLQGLLDYAKRNPRKISFATTGIGTGHHLNSEQMMRIAGIEMVHVPYKGGQQQMQDLLGGQVPIAFAIVGTVAPFVKQGKIRILAITSSRRYKALPDVPTVAEVVPGYESLTGWMGYFGPRGLPQPIVSRLHGEIGAVLSSADLAVKLEQIGFVVDLGTPAELTALLKRDLALAAKLARMAGVQPE